MNKPFVVIGATSGIAEAFLHEIAQTTQKNFLIVGRDNSKLDAIANDLIHRYSCKIDVACIDFLDFPAHQDFVEQTWKKYNGLSGVLVAHGTLGEQKDYERNFDKVEHAFQINVLSPISFITHLANLFEEQGSGQIAVITSVAADRGRASNYVYGSTKAALATYVSGLRARLFRSGVAVIDIRPGFISTAMTSHLPRGPLFVTTKTAAKRILKAIHKNEAIAYVPRFWSLIMWVIRFLPDCIFKRLKL